MADSLWTLILCLILFTNVFPRIIITNIFSKIGKKFSILDDIKGRWGGEEFIIILPETSKKSSYNVAKKIKDNIKGFFIKNYDKNITISIGISSIEKDDDKISLIDKADKGLYIAKKTGKDKVINYN